MRVLNKYPPALVLIMAGCIVLSPDAAKAQSLDPSSDPKGELSKQDPNADKALEWKVEEPDDKVDAAPARTPETRKAHLPPVAWKDTWRRFSMVDGFVSFGFGASIILSSALGPRASGPTAFVGIDESVRDALRSPGYRGRLRAADVSDVLLGLSVSYALVGDPLLNATWLRDSEDAGQQIALLNTEVTAVTLGVQQMTANLVGRERPYGRTCGDEIGEDVHKCTGGDRYRSHFSGHTSVPFSLAAATCVSHMYLPLSGGRAWIPCVSGFALAATTGTLRIVADYHYATDVLVGALVGSAIGGGLALSRYMGGGDPLLVQSGEWRGHLLPGFGGIGFDGRPIVGATFTGALR